MMRQFAWGRDGEISG